MRLLGFHYTWNWAPFWEEEKMVRIACGPIVGTVLLLVLPIASPLVAIHVVAVQVEVCWYWYNFSKNANNNLSLPVKILFRDQHLKIIAPRLERCFLLSDYKLEALDFSLLSPQEKEFCREQMGQYRKQGCAHYFWTSEWDFGISLVVLS